jgi:hypothetical protein
LKGALARKASVTVSEAQHHLYFYPSRSDTNRSDQLLDALRQIQWDENVKFAMGVPELDAETGGRWVLGLIVRKPSRGDPCGI